MVRSARVLALVTMFGCSTTPSSPPGDGPPRSDDGVPAAQPAPSGNPPESAPPSPTGEPAAAPQGLDGPPRVLYVGRFETTDPAGPKASWPGSRIVTRFLGTSISATLREYAADWMDGAPSYWDVIVDHVPTAVLTMIPDDTPHVFELASNLPDGPHEVELYKRSEMQTGVTQFLGFDLHGGRALEAPVRRARHIEAMTDSYGTGYGIEWLGAPNLECGVNHAGKYQNFRRAWPSLLAQRFDAEIEGTVYSGKGLTRGSWPTDTDGLIDYYKRSNPNPAMAHNPPLFDLSSWVPDVILLVQGTVDHRTAGFRDIYRDFVVKQLRARAPSAHIFLVVPGHYARDVMIATVTSVARERQEAGDTKVYAAIPGGEMPEEMTGCGYHGAPRYHERITNELAELIAEKVGW